MGHKVHPKGFRLGIVADWESIWFAKTAYPVLILEDMKLRDYLFRQTKRAGVSSVIIKRRADQIEVDLYAARPGILIGKGGEEVQKLREEMRILLQKRVNINVKEEKNPENNAKFLAEMIAIQLEKRVAFRRAMRQVIMRARKAGAQGIKVECSGRLNGAEIARREWYREGRVPLQTIRADIDYAFTEALTTYGKIGVKVWVYKGDILKKDDQASLAMAQIRTGEE
jgi:small subunit ribosomal protein S3